MARSVQRRAILPRFDSEVEKSLRPGQRRGLRLERVQPVGGLLPNLVTHKLTIPHGEAAPDELSKQATADDA